MTTPDPPPPTPARLRFRVGTPLLYWVPVAGVMAVIGWSKTINLLLLLGYLMLALVAVNAVLAWRMTRRLTARRRDTPPVFAGEPVAHAVEVANPTNRSATARVGDVAVGQPAVWFLAPLPGRESTVLRATWTFPRRGRFPVGPLTADSEYPFGLVGWVRELGPVAEIRVLPAVGTVGVEAMRRWLIRAGGGEGRARRPARRPTPGLGDVRGVRPYRVGDSPRDIHWKTTARRNQLVVREYDQTDPLNLVVVVDPWLPAGATPEHAARLEWALAAAVSIGWAWATADEPGDFTLVIPGDATGTPPETHTGRATPGFVRSAFASFADLAGSAVVPGVPLAVLRAGAVRTARLVVSSRPDSPVAAGLRAAGVGAAAIDPTAAPRWYLPAG